MDEPAPDYDAILQQETALDQHRRTLASDGVNLAMIDRQRLNAVQASKEHARAAHAAGITEAEMVRIVGVNRTTIRRWLGKQTS